MKDKISLNQSMTIEEALDTLKSTLYFLSDCFLSHFYQWEKNEVFFKGAGIILQDLSKIAEKAYDAYVGNQPDRRF